MKIAIIAKLSKFKNEYSLNRIKFLNYLSERSSNIYLYDEKFFRVKDINVLNIDIIIYYWLTKYNDYNKMLIKDFNKIKISKLLLVEDIYHIDSYPIFYNKYNFNGIILHYKNSRIKELLKNIKYIYELPQFIDNKINRDCILKKEIDILFYGDTNNKYYPFRNKICRVLKKINKYYNVKIIKKEDNIINEELSLYINRSYLTVCTRSRFDITLKRYQEVILNKSVILGNIPNSEKYIYKNKVIRISNKMSDMEIIYIIKNALKDKKRLEELAEKKYKCFMNEYSYENGYNKLIDLLHCHDQNVKNFSH